MSETVRFCAKSPPHGPEHHRKGVVAAGFPAGHWCAECEREWRLAPPGFVLFVVPDPREDPGQATASRFFTYVGPNESGRPTTLHIDLSVVSAIHILEAGPKGEPAEVYLEGDLNWTLRPENVDVPRLLAAWQEARR